MVAAARAVASRAPDALVSDQFAARLVHAVEVDFFARIATGERDPSAGTTDLLAQHGLPPIEDDDAPFGEVIYVSAELR